MTKLLYIQTSPRGEHSRSLAVASTFVTAYQQAHPTLELDILDLSTEELPPFDQNAAEGKMARLRGEEASSAAETAFAHVANLIEAFRSADFYVFAVPMWNFGIPYTLKHYLDLIIQPTYTFAVGKDGYEGLLTDRTAFVAYARGGEYAEDDPADFQRPYLECALRFMGITEIHSVVVQPTVAGNPNAMRARLEEAQARAREIAASL